MNKSEATAAFEETSFLYGGNAKFIEELYQTYLTNPAAVDAHWRSYFDQLAGETAAPSGPSWARTDWPPKPSDEQTAALDGNWVEVEKAIAAKLAASLPKSAKPAPAAAAPASMAAAPAVNADEIKKATMDSVRALMMIRAFRMRGHLAADLDPLKLKEPMQHPELDPATYGFGPADLDRPIFLDMVLGLEKATVRQIIDILRRTYCGTLGVEFMHISDPEQKSWLQQRIEGENKEIRFTPQGKKAILAKLIAGEDFEQFLNVKYTGTKRFGLDGGESMIPALEQVIKRGGNLGVQEIVVGMAHRGRLNVLANVMGKPFSAIFHEFQGGSSTPDEVEGSGDVKYHLGSSSDRAFRRQHGSPVADRKPVPSRNR